MPTGPSRAPSPPPFVRGGRLSLPDDEPDGPVEFDELTEVNNPRQRAFLQALVHTPRTSAACRAAGISGVAAWKWTQDQADVAFQRAYVIAKQLGIQRAESEAWRRAHDGYETPVYHQGRLIGTERAYSDGLMQFMLKGALPEKYRERYEHSGAGGGPIQVQAVDPDTLTTEQLLERVERVRQGLVEPVRQMATDAVAAAVAEAKATVLDEAAEAYAQALALRKSGGNGNGGPA